MDRRHGERRQHMPDAVSRTCTDIISNEGTELRAEPLQEAPCGLDAMGYCVEDARYVCSIHWQSNHSLHKVARR